MPDLNVEDRGDVIKMDDVPDTKPEIDKTDLPETDKLEEEKDEETETAEEKAEREKAEAEAEAKKRIRIPKARFDEAQSKARAREQALLEEIEKLKGGQQTTAAQKSVSEAKTKIEELQDKYEDLILDGKKDEARAIRKKIDVMRDELVDYQTSIKSDAARKAAVEELTYSAQLANFETKFSTINPDHEDFDEEKTAEVGVLMNAFVKSGMKRADALGKAVKYVLGTPVEPVVAPKDKRAEDARKKAAEADKKQPASSTKVGLDSDKAGSKPGDIQGIDVMRLSQDKFKKLEEDTLAKLRGDEV